MKTSSSHRHMVVGGWLAAASLLGNPVVALDIPDVNKQAVKEIIEDHRAQCKSALGDNPGDLMVDDESTYEMVIDDKGTTATVLITDFSCGDLSPMWCGSGGCDSYVVVNGKTFVWRVSFPPYSFEITNPYSSKVRKAVLFPLHGGYCVTANQGSGYGAFGCYEIALWDDQRETFMTRSGVLTEYDPLGP
ncbi:MAG: hypothetical protein K9G71_04815 [Rhodobacteraceae bacterium]|nr:hypothetical protein [Paracoccaceae bacterium]MCF8513198.1 hypothetical protein [Paracoccaceae bacterium]MCF8517903.1 hypothetical protein [Paracoccaceae bacterium]